MANPSDAKHDGDAPIFLTCAEERERPELLAESRERRKRVAKDSGKTEQQVLIMSSFPSICSSMSLTMDGCN